ncbi:MAG: hypothetical protein K0R02_1244 [Rickettsiaceae bacterium]|jgi:hypothetical protein|nr:hypothetical protein [Rickettsiaceae bacterium]
MIKKLFILLVSSLVISCVYSGGQVANAPVNPEALVDTSSEKTSFGLTSESSLEELSSWIDQDTPTHAELACEGDLCSKAASILSSFAVPYRHVAAADNKNQVILSYERSMARDCRKRANGFAVGCAAASNMVDMISDRQQLTSPPVSGQPDAESAVKNFFFK